MAGLRRLRPVSYLSVFSFSFSDRSCAYDDTYVIHHGRVSRLVTVLSDPFTRPNAHFFLNGRRCQPGNTQNGGTVLPIANLMADSESGSPNSYSSCLVTIRLPRLVLEILACDRQTDGRTDGQSGPLL